MTFNNGWNWLFNSSRMHYFVDHRSLCGSWMIFGNNRDANTLPRLEHCCKACQKKFAKLDMSTNA